MIPATWCISGNVGDRITPWLIEKMSGQQPVYINQTYPIPHFMACGSILTWATEHTIVWGAGVLSRNEPINRLADIWAVRGPLARKQARNHGATCPEIYGDPGILCPLFCPAEHTHEFTVGVIPHYVDQYIVAAQPLPAGWRFLSVFDDVETFARNVCRCDLILSSALHGLILADAYGVPSVRIVIGSRMGGDGVKFADYFASVDRDDGQALLWRQCRNSPVRDLMMVAEVGNVEPLLAPLLAACPWPCLKGTNEPTTIGTADPDAGVPSGETEGAVGEADEAD